MARAINEVLRDYERIATEHAGPWLGFCWTVIRPVLDRGEVLARVGTDVTWSAPVRLDEVWDYTASDDDLDAAWVITIGDAVGLLEFNGFAGSRQANLAAWSNGVTCRVVSFYWNEAIGSCQLSEARDGQVQEYDIQDDYDDLDDVPWLQSAIAAMRSARSGTDVAVEGLALVEMLSDIQLTRDALDAAWPVIQFTSHPEQRTLSPEQQDLAGLTAAFQAAPTAQQDEALIHIIDRVITVTGLDDQPAATHVIDRIRRGDVMQRSHDELAYLGVQLQDEAPPVPRSGKIDLHNMAWRRLQAGSALAAALGQPRIEAIANEYGPLYHSRWALDEHWPSTRAQALAILSTR